MMNYEQRSIDIDKLVAPASHVITGVRFRNLGGHLNLEAQVMKYKLYIHPCGVFLGYCGGTTKGKSIYNLFSVAKVTPIKFRSGQLMPDKSIWIGNDNTPATMNSRKQFFLLSPDIPTRFKGKSLIDTTTNQFLAFDTTSPEKDVSKNKASMPM